MRCRCDHSCWENPVLVGSRVQDRGRTAAVELRSGLDVTPGILGMELLRLGLERGRTAAEAVTVMTDLLETYGQYGAGTVSTDRAAAAYDNSFLVADPTEAGDDRPTMGHQASPESLPGAVQRAPAA